jgi:hypothetical protein
MPVRPDSQPTWPVKRKCPCGKVFFSFSSLRLLVEQKAARAGTETLLNPPVPAE